MSDEEHHHSHKDEEVFKGYPLPASKERINKLKIAKIMIGGILGNRDSAAATTARLLAN